MSAAEQARQQFTHHVEGEEREEDKQQKLPAPEADTQTVVHRSVPSSRPICHPEEPPPREVADDQDEGDGAGHGCGSGTGRIVATLPGGA